MKRSKWGVKKNFSFLILTLFLVDFLKRIPKAGIILNCVCVCIFKGQLVGLSMFDVFLTSALITETIKHS